MTAAERNKQALRELLRTVDRRELDSLESFYHPDYTEHGGAVKSHQPGVDGVREGFAAFTAAFDNIRHDVDDLVAEGDRVAARITFSGTFVRPLFGAPPTGQRVTAWGIALYRFADGRIREKWGTFNALAHLGLLGPPR